MGQPEADAKVSRIDDGDTAGEFVEIRTADKIDDEDVNAQQMAA